MTLNQTAILTKQIITISIIVLVLGIGSFAGYKIWYAYYLAQLPPVEEKPDTRFGLLPPVEFPKSDVSSSNFSYSLDTTTGGLPKVGVDQGFEKIVKVYFVNQPLASLLSSEKSEILAEKFGITTPAEIGETNYRFKEQGRDLSINLISGNFSFTNEATISAKETLDDDSRLISDFQTILNNLTLLKDDLKKGRSKIVPLKKEGETLTPISLRSEAEAAQISLWPASINEKSIFTADFDKALVNAVVRKSAANLENYSALNFIYYSIDTTTFATYPIKTAEAAFEDLKNGKGVVIVDPKKPQVSISSVYLGYFLSENYSPYLQPIFIFEGPNFVSYVPAVIDRFQSR